MLVTHVEEYPAQARGVGSPAFAMLEILAITLPAGIMEDSEEPHHLNKRAITGGDFQCVRFNPPPVTRPVNGIRAALKLLGNMSPYCIEVDGSHVSHRSYFTRPTIKSLGPGSLTLCTSVNPAADIQPAYSSSL